jgi:ABC-type uncharacterized transport system fused permease/ATPase subunit
LYFFLFKNSFDSILIFSALKYYTGVIALNTRVRLSEHVHVVYLEGTNFYKASNLGDNKIKNAYASSCSFR